MTMAETLGLKVLFFMSNNVACCPDNTGFACVAINAPVVQALWYIYVKNLLS